MFDKELPRIVVKAWPTWKGFAIFGDENSTITFLPSPIFLLPYWSPSLMISEITDLARTPLSILKLM